MGGSSDDANDAAYHFFDILVVAALPWVAQERMTGGTRSGVAWEVRDDLRGRCAGFLHFWAGSLSSRELDSITLYLEETSRLPGEIFSESGHGDGFGLRHPLWEDQRRRSTQLLRLLEARARDVFKKFELSTADLDALLGD